MTPLERLSVIGRILALAAVTGLCLVTGLDRSWPALFLMATISLAFTYLALSGIRSLPVVVVEAIVVGSMVALAAPTGALFLPYLLTLTLVAGLTHRWLGAAVLLVVQLATMLLPTMLPVTSGAVLDTADAWSWFLASAVAGLIGAWARDFVDSPAMNSEETYAQARRLLGQLREVSRELSTGLDVEAVAGDMARVLESALPAHQIAIFAGSRDAGFSPLIRSGDRGGGDLSPNHPDFRNHPAALVAHLDDSDVIALPLEVGSRPIGVAVARVDSTTSKRQKALAKRLLDPHAVKLEAALLFAEVRTLATTEERRRVAREIHDGIAQELASLGYEVDDLAEGADAQIRHALIEHRRRISDLVNELRLSIFDLRAQTSPEAGLGAALSDYLRHVGTRSDFMVHLSIDESSSRLRSDVEIELLRIAGEAITNARRHARATCVRVQCTVHPPFAQITVEDDGVGLHHGRADSYGIRIMRERADRIDAHLEIAPVTRDSRRPGTRVRVTLGSDAGSSRSVTENGFLNARRAEQTTSGR